MGEMPPPIQPSASSSQTSNQSRSLYYTGPSAPSEGSVPFPPSQPPFVTTGPSNQTQYDQLQTLTAGYRHQVTDQRLGHGIRTQNSQLVKATDKRRTVAQERKEKRERSTGAQIIVSADAVYWDGLHTKKMIEVRSSTSC